MAEEDLRERAEGDYMSAVNVLILAEKEYSQEFLLAKMTDVTDKTAEHMAMTKAGENLLRARALEKIARGRLERASEST